MPDARSGRDGAIEPQCFLSGMLSKAVLFVCRFWEQLLYPKFLLCLKCMLKLILKMILPQITILKSQGRPKEEKGTEKSSHPGRWVGRRSHFSLKTWTDLGPQEPQG